MFYEWFSPKSTTKGRKSISFVKLEPLATVVQYVIFRSSSLISEDNCKTSSDLHLCMAGKVFIILMITAFLNSYEIDLNTLNSKK